MAPFWHALWIAVEMGAVFVTIAVLGLSVYVLAARPHGGAARGGMQ